MDKLIDYIENIINENIINLTFSNKVCKEQKLKKIQVRLINLKDVIYYQFEYLDEKNAKHRNILEGDIKKEILDILNNEFKQMNGICETMEFQLKVSKRGKSLFTSKRIRSNVVIKKHNKEKSYILSEGTVVPPLIDIGVMDSTGKVLKGQHNKFVQINKFLEQMEYSLRDYNDDKITIVDFGCGKSYLTFIIYYYLQFIRDIEPTIIGLDLKEDVINSCNNIAKKYGYGNIIFMTKNIEDYVNDNVVNMVVSLHACDTATDYALYNAIKWNSKYILSVPCCQNEINSQLKQNKNDTILKHGIIRERFSSLLTDVIRADILESYGYSVDVIEFIDFDNSPKNLMIRAIKISNFDEKKLEVAKNTIGEYGIQQTLYKLLKKG